MKPDIIRWIDAADEDDIDEETTAVLLVIALSAVVAGVAIALSLYIGGVWNPCAVIDATSCGCLSGV